MVRNMSYERSNIRAMQGYQYGEQTLDRDVVKLNTNENPYSPSPAVATALREFNINTLRRYPCPDATDFRVLAARIHQTSPEQILVTNGGDELLRLAVTTFVEPGGIIGCVTPDYSLHATLAAIHDATLMQVPLSADWELPESFAMRMNRARARLTFLSNPQTPSGCLLTLSTIRKLAASLDGVLLLDQAYIDFATGDQGTASIDLIREFDNVLLLRTLSKGYSLAGLRFGYALGDSRLLEPMRVKTKDSYNIDAIAQCLAQAALTDQNHARDTWEKVRAERTRLIRILTDKGWRVPPSQGNFILVEPATDEGIPAPHLFHELRRRGILVRYFNQPKLRNALRITIGTAGENERLLATLDECTRSISVRT